MNVGCQILVFEARLFLFIVIVISFAIRGGIRASSVVVAKSLLSPPVSTLVFFTLSCWPEVKNDGDQPKVVVKCHGDHAKEGVELDRDLVAWVAIQ